MKTPTAFRPTLLSLFGSLLLASAVGCAGVVTKGGGEDPEELGSSGDGDGGFGGVGGGGAGGYNAGGANPTGGSGGYCDPGACQPAADSIALTYAQIDGSSGSTGSGSTGSDTTTGSGGGLDPATQFLKLGAGTEAPTCAEPHGSGGCGGWSVTVSIAPALFQVGVVALADPGVDITFSESMSEGNGLCSGGGGGGLEDGQIEIVAIHPTSVDYIISGVSPLFAADPNGFHSALRCQ